MKNVIITGVNGFIGKAICKELLNNDIFVYAIVRDRKTVAELENNKNIEIIELDFDNYELMPQKIHKDIDTFYHMAWSGTSGSVLSDYKMQITNIYNVCRTIEIAHKINCKKFILAGTINELELIQYFNAEMNSPRPACIYGIAKLASDFMCKTLAAECGIKYNTAIIGSCFGYGDYSKRIHNTFISNMLSNTKPKLVTATNLHDWIYIDDVAKMFYMIGKKSVNMKNYYLGHNHLRPLKDILIEVRDILNPSMQLVFGEIEQNFEIDYSLVDINALYIDTGYECNSDFRECILKTAQWVKENNI